MPNNPNQVLMGTTTSSVREVVSNVGTKAAGIVVRRDEDGLLTTTKADGEIFGASLGGDLSGAGFTAVCKAGLGVPVQLKAGFDPDIGGVVEIDDATGLATGDGSKTATKGVFATGRIGDSGDNGVQEDGTMVGVALVDIPGGF